MSKAEIRKSIQQLRKKIEQRSPVWKFRGKPVIPVGRWEPEDWTTFPDQYHIGFGLWLRPPPDWWKDYLALLTKLEDPRFGQALCSNCAINLAQKAKEDMARCGWDHRGGEEAKEKFYKTCEPSRAVEFRREDAMRKTKLRLYNETAKANNRTCDIINYFKCPYGEERDQLTKNGEAAEKLRKLVEWYDKHWNPCRSTIIPPEDEKKWYHKTETGIIDVTNLEDILKAVEDGRIEKISEEQERFKKEHPRNPLDQP
jgi:hypothetical protein